MLKLGLTGGIGSGKSAAAAHLSSLGAVIVDSDVLAREVVAPGTDGLAEVAEAFGPEVVTDGALDRPALARAVFGDDAARRRLEAIIHPRVRARADELTAAAGERAIVVNDVPLLAEVGLAPTFHLVMVVEVPVGTRIARLEARGMGADEARARIAAQLDDAGRREVADVVLDNSGSLGDLHAQIDRLWESRLVPYERNVRESRIVRRPDVPTLVPYDPEWPARFRRIAARIRHTMGPAALSVDHVGSTSVPGLSAKDVIDVQVAVADLGVADAAADALAAAGFPVLTGIDRDTPKPFAPDPADWMKRLHGGTDPGVVTHVHIRPEGSPGWRYALMFRDWLRADDDARDEYGAHKLALAASRETTSEYAAAKEPWFDEILPRAEAWVEKTGWEPGRQAR